MKFIFDPGEFKHKIEIRRFEIKENEDNIPTPDYILLFSPKAKIVNVRGEEYYLAQGSNVKVSKTFYIRYSKKYLITEDDIVIYKGNKYNIKYVNDIEEAHVLLELKCEVKK